MKARLHKTLFPLQFVVVGFILTLNGYQIFSESGNFLGWLISFLGVLAIGYFIYIKRTNKSVRLLEAFVFLIQGLALILLCNVDINFGKIWLPYLSFLAAAGYFTACVISLDQLRKSKKSIPIE